jgi:DNA-binding NarL/FixJ family response regulator
VNEPLRIVVGEDQPLMREGIVSVLERAGFDVVAVAEDADTLVRATLAARPDVMLTDIRMPPSFREDGLRAAIEVRARDESIGVVVLSQYLEDSYALDLVGDQAARVGYLLKEKIASPEVLVDAIRRVADGGTALDPDVIARLIGRNRRAGPLDALTERERVVLSLMAEGLSNNAIAQRLVVTVAAVERHVTGILGKLNLPQDDAEHHRRVVAVLRFLQG